MSDKEEGEENIPRGNEWEVVSLTASAYAASPGPKEVESKDDDNVVAYAEAETSQALFMSSHFVFPPSEHENLPMEPENTQIHQDSVSKDVVSELEMLQEGRSSSKDEEWSKDLNVPDELSEMPFVDEKIYKEQSIYKEATRSLHSETVLGRSGAYNEETPPVSELSESSEEGLNIPADVSQLPETVQNDKYSGSNLPCEAWWRRRAASLYAHAKEANAVWSIFVAAAVMGLVILGQRWQQERWQVLQLRWQSTVNDEVFN